MAEGRPAPRGRDPRITALVHLTPVLFGVHSLLLPWFSSGDDRTGATAGFWSVLQRSAFEESVAVVGAWRGLVVVGVALTITCLVRAATPAAQPSWTATGLAAVLAALALVAPLAMRAAITAAGSQTLDVSWGGPVTLALAAVWVVGACLPGERSGASSGSAGRRGWDVPPSNG